MTIEEVKHYVAQRKLIYQRSLAQADKMLQAIVSQDPKRLAACEAVQADYAGGVAGLKLRALEQPAAPEPVEVVTEPAKIEKALADTVETSKAQRRTAAWSANEVLQTGKAGDGGEPVK
jgi:hypothetical protein